MMMTRGKKSDQAVTIAVMPAIILAVAGIIGSICSYKAGIDSIQIPIRATQTAQAMQITVNNSSNALDPSKVPVAIDAQQSWQSTGFQVSTGDVVSVKVVGGKWSGWRSAEGEFKWPENAGEGFAVPVECGSEFSAKNYVQHECPVKQANVTSLVARVASTKYAIGNHCIFKVAADGILEFNINEDYKPDNFGVLAILIAKLDSPNVTLDNDCGYRSE